MGLCLGFVTVLQELCKTLGGRPEGKKRDCPGLENMGWAERLLASTGRRGPCSAKGWKGRFSRLTPMKQDKEEGIYAATTQAEACFSWGS